MAETGRSGGPSKPEIEERWKDVVEALTERPRDADLLVQAGQLSEQLSRQPEAYAYYHKALTLDPSKGFLVTKLRTLALTPAQKDDVTKISRRPTSFTASLGDIFKYPLRGKGVALLIMGALLLWVARGLLNGGIPGMIIAAMVAAYMAIFYIDVCHTTVGGEDQLPDWPDPLRLHEFGLDVGKFVCAMVFSFLPVILIWLGAALFSATPDDLPQETVMTEPVVMPAQPLDPDNDKPTATPQPRAPAAPVVPKVPVAPELSPLEGTFTLSALGIVVFSLVGLVYLPMATLANVVMGSPFTCFNFPFVFRSIGSTAGNYMICLACCFGVLLIVGAAEFVVTLTDVILFTGLVLAFIELYGMTVLMRLLGLFYRMTQAKLGWLTD
jgi:hypothetical protein